MERVNVEIGFPSITQANIAVNWIDKLQEDNGNNAKFNETLLFLCYVLRQLRNLGIHPNDFSPYHLCLSQCINEIDEQLESLSSPQFYFTHHCISHRYEDMNIQTSFAKESKEGFSVIEKGLFGKGFIGKLSYRYIGSTVMPVFNLEARGFGLSLLTGKNIPLYALDSILVFYTFLLSRYKTQKGYFEEISQLLDETILEFAYGNTNMANQEIIAFEKILQYENNRVD